MESISDRGYVHPEMLVSTDWVAKHLNDPSVRIVESNEDELLYRSSHIPGAVELDWVRHLNDPLVRDYLSSETFAATMEKLGITPDTTIVLYGDKNNWWAAFSMWVLHLFDHKNVRIMDGGRVLWEKENRPMTKDIPQYSQAEYPIPKRDDTRVRALREDVFKHIKKNGSFVDVRSPDEYSGKRLHMEGYPNEGALRGGHVPGAKSVPWARAVNPDTGMFKNAAELRSIYENEAGFTPKDDIIVYCRIGERSSHTWFVLKYLLGYSQVRNYDGSWTEWGNLVGAPIEKDT